MADRDVAEDDRTRQITRVRSAVNYRRRESGRASWRGLRGKYLSKVKAGKG